MGHIDNERIMCQLEIFEPRRPRLIQGTLCVPWKPSELHERCGWIQYAHCWECDAMPGEPGCYWCTWATEEGYRDNYPHLFDGELIPWETAGEPTSDAASAASTAAAEERTG